MTQTIPPIVMAPSVPLMQNYITGLEYSLLDENYKGIHPPVLCKDFLSDVYWSEYVKKPVNIYGFSHSPGKYPQYLNERQFIGIRFQDQEIGSRQQNVQAFLNAFAAPLGFHPIQVKSANGGKMLLIDYGKEWTQKPVYISLLTLLIRVSLNYEGQDINTFIETMMKNGEQVLMDPYSTRSKQSISPYGRNDYYTIYISKNKIKTILNGKYNPQQTWQEYQSADAMHNGSGFVNHSGDEYYA